MLINKPTHQRYQKLLGGGARRGTWCPRAPAAGCSSTTHRTLPSADANTDDLVRYRWLADRPIDLPEALEIAQFDLLGFSANETSHVYVTG